MKTVILVPRREGVAERDEAWRLARSRWEALFPEYEIFEGHHDDGPFNRAKALNSAARQAGDWDTAIVIDADIFISRKQVVEGVTRSQMTGLVVWPFTQWKGLSEAGTRALMQSPPETWTEYQELEGLVEKTNPVSWSCCIVVPRKAWDTLGGFDERFQGWGFEDMAFQSAVVGLIGHVRMPGAVYHMWHPRSPGLGKGGLSQDSIRNARLGRRYMVACRRDYGMTDRLSYTDAAEMERDIANLKRDDAKYSSASKRLKLGIDDDWWPTLEELTGGAKTASADAAIHRTTVTIAVHTDGRREFIAQSIPSLERQVTGNVIKRVIYDDSGDPQYKTWLRENFEPLGYYVVGPDKRVGYTESMSLMWQYLTNRCTSQWVFLAEDDFLYDEPVDLGKMAGILDRHPYLRQVALLRHAYYSRELDAGGIIAEHPDEYEAREDGDDRWLEHRLYFTANPSLFARSLCGMEPWPSRVASSERVYTERLNRDPRSRMAYLGHGEEVVTHIGSYRAGGNY